MLQAGVIELALLHGAVVLESAIADGRHAICTAAWRVPLGDDGRHEQAL